MKNRLTYALAAAVLVVGLGLASCTSDINTVTSPNVAEPGNIAGAWSGSARWDALQGGGAGAVTSGSATAIFFQSGAAVTSSTWGVPGVFTGTLTGSVDASGNVTGSATVRPTGAGCSSTAPWGGQLSGNTLSMTMSFADPGSVPCAAAPVGLTLNLSR